jgi:hypothetical protein
MPGVGVPLNVGVAVRVFVGVPTGEGVLVNVAVASGVMLPWL